MSKDEYNKTLYRIINYQKENEELAKKLVKNFEKKINETAIALDYDID
jgi:hypothetical protein